MNNNDIIPRFDDQTDEHLSIHLVTIAEMPKYIAIYLKGHADRGNVNFFQQKIIGIVHSGFSFLIICCADFEIRSDIVGAALWAILKSISEAKGCIVFIEVNPALENFFSFAGVEMFFKFKDNLAEAIEFLRQKGEHPPSFPIALNCPACGRNLKASSSGPILCYECRTISHVDRWGDVSRKDE
jgi:anti-anti-sigma regulatory factor